MYDFNQFLNNPTVNNMNPNLTQNVNPNMMPMQGTPCNQMQNPVMQNQPMQTPVMQGPCCLQNKSFCQYVPQPCNFHTHTVNTVIRKRYIVPTYTNSEETVFVDENPCGSNRQNRRLF